MAIVPKDHFLYRGKTEKRIRLHKISSQDAGNIRENLCLGLKRSALEALFQYISWRAPKPQSRSSNPCKKSTDFQRSGVPDEAISQQPSQLSLPLHQTSRIII